MSQKILFFFLFICHLGFSQSNSVAAEEIKKIIAKSGAHLSDLECDKSLVLAKKALEKALVINDNELIARSYNIIGLNLDEYYDFTKAIYFFNKGLKYANKTKSDFIKYSLNNNIARTYCFRNIDYKKGIYHYKIGLYYAKLLKDDYEIMYANINLATAYFAVADYKSGFSYLQTAKPAVERGEELEAKISYNSLLGAYYSHKNDFLNSELFYKKALEYCSENKPEFLEGNAVEVYDDIAGMYSKKGDFEKAYFYIDKYNVLKDKLQIEEHTKLEKISGMSLVFDDYKRQINQLELQKARQNQIIYQNKVIGILFVGFFLILIILLITLYKNNIFRKKSNFKLLEINRKLKIAKKQAVDTSILKTQFISTISHELRTPLYGVVGIVDILKEEHPELVNSIYIDSLKFSANYLLSLVNDVLQISKIENKQIILENTTFNIFNEMNSILETISVLYKMNNNKVSFKIDDKIPHLLIGDKDRLLQILFNIVGNSLKFTKEGEVFLTLNLIDKKDDFCEIEFEVSDTGIGIAAENQIKIFDRFVQLNDNANYHGSGLGLSIVKKLIDLFDSKIELQSELGKGTSFKFKIKFKNHNSNLINIESDSFKKAIFLDLNVLIVDDNKLNQLVTRKILEASKCNCTVVEKGIEALEILKTKSFDLILMDINMPGMNGFETTINIRNSNILTPIIALTAFPKHEVAEEVTKSGMNAIVVKPFKNADLYATISELITKNAD